MRSCSTGTAPMPAAVKGRPASTVSWTRVAARVAALAAPPVALVRVAVVTLASRTAVEQVATAATRPCRCSQRGDSGWEGVERNYVCVDASLLVTAALMWPQCLACGTWQQVRQRGPRFAATPAAPQRLAGTTTGRRAEVPARGHTHLRRATAPTAPAPTRRRYANDLHRRQQRRAARRAARSCWRCLARRGRRVGRMRTPWHERRPMVPHDPPAPPPRPARCTTRQ